MKRSSNIKCVFVDIGGVLLTDGWNRGSRKRAAKAFGLDLAEMEDRHHLNVDTYEAGKLSLNDYLSRVVFYQKRPFTRGQFWRFMVQESKPFPEMIELIREIKVRHKLKVAVLSNEARDLNAYRIRKFKLDNFVDFFVSSCFVRVRKPDLDIFRLALDIAQTPADQIVYIENTPLFVEIGKGLGIRGIVHKDFQTTRVRLTEFGLDSAEVGKE
jgi:putative hydrolase of the HAD superfamily